MTMIKIVLLRAMIIKYRIKNNYNHKYNNHIIKIVDKVYNIIKKYLRNV